MKLSIIQFSFSILLGVGVVQFQGQEKQSQKFTGIDSMFSNSYIDVEEWRTKPVKHLYVHGGFKGTDTKFSFYYPEKTKYEGRFYQYITPVPDSENLSQNSEPGEADKIAFALTHGAYFVETNGGGNDAGIMAKDKTIGAYKANAASAYYSKIKSQEIYGKHKVFAYAFGGSGGAYRTIGSIENTDGVWHGVVPYVVGSPMAIPNVFTVRMHAMRILKNKFPQIVDALEPGGSGNMYEGLNSQEINALKEVTAMGFPPIAWYNYSDMGVHAFPAIYSGMLMADAAYFKDFWTKSGYLGKDNPKSFDGAILDEKAIVNNIITKQEAQKLGLLKGEDAGKARGTADAAWKNLGYSDDGSVPVALKLNKKLANVQFLGGDLEILSGLGKAKIINVKSIDNDIVFLENDNLENISKIKSGDEIRIGNRNYLAAQTYHRHQVPGADYPVFNQFKNSDGTPRYPQRPLLLGPMFTKSTVGSLPSGKFNGKMILLESLWDTEAYPWQADWYFNKVKEQKEVNYSDNFRIWFTDHANHSDLPMSGNSTHIVSYLGVIQQALVDLSNWVEKGATPPSDTEYNIVDGQVVVPEKANQRNGIQPTIDLKANGSSKAEVKKREKVIFKAVVTVPANAGKIVSLEWDFEGIGNFKKNNNFKKGKDNLELSTYYKYSKPGTYFAVLRIASQREGDTNTEFTLIRNLKRVRVVVE